MSIEFIGMIGPKKYRKFILREARRLIWITLKNLHWRTSNQALIEF